MWLVASKAAVLKQDFGGGAIGSAVASSGLTGDTSNREWNAIAKRTAIAATAGGIATELGGGKFSNGARSAAFVHLFNAEAIGSTFSNRETEVLRSRMQETKFETQSTTKSLLINAASALRPASFSAEIGTGYYHKIDTIRINTVWYQSYGNSMFAPTGRVDFGSIIRAINMDGRGIDGYNYIGQGVYSRRRWDFQPPTQ